MSLLEDLQQDLAEQRRPRTYHNARDVVEMLQAPVPSNLPPPVLSLDMYIAYREEFRGGWVLWLGNREAANMSPELRQQLSSMSFERKAKHFFRLSLWVRSGAGGHDDITEIPDGAEIFVARVTGLRLYDNMAQGNENRVEIVVNVEEEDDTADPPSLNSPSVAASVTPIGQTPTGLASQKPSDNSVTLPSVGETGPDGERDDIDDVIKVEVVAMSTVETEVKQVIGQSEDEHKRRV